MPIPLDQHGQPLNLTLNYLSNARKAAMCLRGILVGITADRALNGSEILFLDSWLGTASAIAEHGDVVDLLHLLNRILADGRISEEDIESLDTFIHDILEYGDQTGDSVENRINELFGLLNGIVADGVINEKEFHALDGWLARNPDIQSVWPANVLLHKLALIKEDGRIDQEELRDLLEMVEEISGHRFYETGLGYGLVSEFFSSEVDSFDHAGKSLCFTGKFLNGSRADMEGCAVEKGAVIKPDVSRDLDALIVGTYTSRDWKYTSYGTKIERVLEYNKTGGNILILPERKWLRFLQIG